MFQSLEADREAFRARIESGALLHDEASTKYTMGILYAINRILEMTSEDL